MWATLFVFSLVINIVLLLYVRWLLKSIVIINQDVEDASILIDNFSNHVKGVHELEMFYGDETLSSLMEHSRQIVERLENIDFLLKDQGTEEPSEEGEIEVE